jgi:hypothetical protein
MRVTTQRLGHGNDFAHIFDDGLASGHGNDSEHAFAVDAGGQHFDLQWIRLIHNQHMALSGYYEASQRFDGARAMLMLANPI